MSSNEVIDVVFVAGPPGAGKTSVTEAYEAANPNTAQFGTGELVWGISAGRHESKYTDILREASEKKTSLPGEIFSMVVHERIMRLAQDAGTVMVTGFPHDYEDWAVFSQIAADDNLRPIGSVVLTADSEICIPRMQERDINKRVDPALVHSVEAVSSYEKRYVELMARLAVRLDCYRGSGLDVVPISARQTREVVLSEFSDAMDIFKARG